MATDRDAQYDNSAKRLIAHKIILTRILVKTVEEFKGMDPLEVAALIEGLPYISAVPVEPGLTNAVHFQNGQRLVGFNTENQELNEGLVRFDIVFYVRMKDGLSQIIINVLTGDQTQALGLLRDLLCDPHHIAAHDDGQFLMRTFLIDI